MTVGIIPIALGFCRCYVLRADGVIAVDAGASCSRGVRYEHAMEHPCSDPRSIDNL